MSETLMGRLGGLQADLRSQAPPTHIAIDLGQTEWADVTVLLHTICLIASHRAKETRITLDLGREAASTPDHLAFLKFIATQGFLELYAQHCHVTFETRSTVLTDVNDLKTYISSFPYATLLKNADCIKAKLVPCAEFLDRRDDFRKLIDGLIVEARARSLSSAFGGETFIRERLFQKLRRVLHELLANTVLHAYRDGQAGFAAVYVRVHAARPTDPQEQMRWQETLRIERKALAISQFDPNPNSDWLEVFVSDAGVGLLYDLPQWRDQAKTRSIRAVCQRAMDSRDPLYVVAHHVFRSDLSRAERENRAAITGLVHLDNVLSTDHDFSRIYSSGAFLGSHHPWAPRAQGSRKSVGREKFASGTTYSIALLSAAIVGSAPPNWVEPTDQARKLVSDRLARNRTYAPNPEVVLFDRINELDPSARSTNLEEHKNVSDTVVVLRLPESASKNNFSSWINQWAGVRSTPASWRPSTLVLCDLSLHQAAPWAELLPAVQMPKELHLKVLFVANTWQAIGYWKRPGSTRLSPSPRIARDFLLEAGTSATFGAPTLAEVLRQVDSEAFWSDATGSDLSELLRQEKIVWKRADNGDTTTVRGYLDVAHAIAEPSRLAAGKRALHRCIRLFPGAQPLASDDLVRSLLGDFSVLRLGTADSPLPSHVVIGSVCVTSSTISRYVGRKALNVCAAISLLVHPDAPDSEVLPALLWLPARDVAATTEGEARYERIPLTPFIGREGERAISVVRFRPTSGKDPFGEPFFPRTPQAMYADFSQYGMMKTGHWRYGNRHELITVNLGLALELAWVERGDLLDWLVKTLRELIDKDAKLIVYPSHEVTDKLVAILRRIESLQSLLLPTRLIPLRAFAARTVSPLLISPLIQEKVTRVLQGPPNSAGAIILDDGVVTGKHLREIEEFLFSAGARNVYTVALVDRHGSPISEGAVDDYLKKNRRYWRWDVPTMGHTRDCVLCAALRRIHLLASSSEQASHTSRLEEWWRIWEPRDVTEGWSSGGITPGVLSPPIELSFGIRARPDGSIAKNRVEAADSTTLTSLVLELTRLTTKSGIGPKKAKQLLADAPNESERKVRVDAAIEILAAQYLLFFDELDYWQQKERIDALIDLVWQQRSQTAMTALAGMCVSLADVEALVEIWPRFETSLLAEHPVPHVDAALLTSIIWQKVSEAKPVELTATTAGPHTKSNLFIAGVRRGRRTSLAALFEIVGDSPRAAHQTNLRRRVNRLADGGKRTVQETADTTTEILNDLDKLRRALLSLDFGSGADGLPPAHDDAKALEEIATNAPGAASDAVGYWSNQLRTYIYGSDTIDGLAKRYYEALLTPLSSEAYERQLLDTLVRNLHSTWERVLRERFGAIPPRWIGEKERIIRPIVRCASRSLWPRRALLCFDPHVQGALRDVISNVMYAERPIRDPWGAPDIAVVADMWWLPTLEEDRLRLLFLNATDQIGIVLGTKVSNAGLERIGGSIDARVERGTAQVQVCIPLLSGLVKDQGHEA